MEVLSVTGSTNEDARRAADANAPDGHVVLADSQTRGRGSHGREWSSPAGDDLYFSIVDRPALSGAALPPLTLAIGLAVAETVSALVRRRALVKWPNDVWLDGRKCAGVLVEVSSSDAAIGPVVIGVGVNVNRRAWPEELRGGAISLAEASGRALDRASVLASFLDRIEARVDAYVSDGPTPMLRALARRLALRGELVQCGDARGTLLGVAATGALRIETERGVREIVSGTLERAP